MPEDRGGTARRRPCRSSARSARRRCTCRARRPSRRAARSRGRMQRVELRRARPAFFHATISSSRSTCTMPSAAVNSFRRKFRPVRPRSRACRSCGRRARTRSASSCRETSMPPSPVEIVFVGRERPDAGVAPGARRAGRSTTAPCAWAQSSIRTIPSARQSSAIRSTSNAMWPPMCTRNAARRPVLAHLALEVVERHAEVVAVAVDELDPSRRRLIAASGVAMNVFDGQSTVSPRTPAELERGERRARPAVERDRGEAVPARPRGLELGA